MPKHVEQDLVWDALFAQFQVNLLTPTEADDPALATERAANRDAWQAKLDALNSPEFAGARARAQEVYDARVAQLAESHPWWRVSAEPADEAEAE